MRTALLLTALLLAQGQTLEVRIDVPGIGQARANGLYYFKFALVDPAGSVTYWSNDGTSTAGSEPRNGVPLFVDNGFVLVSLGGTPSSSLPPLPEDILQQPEVLLRAWVSSGASSFLRLHDRPLRGTGLASAAELARNSERLEGKRAADFERAGAIKRHEDMYAHTPQGRVPGGRFYHSSSDVGAGRELTVHFDLPPEPRVTLSLHASSPVGAPAITDLTMQTTKTENQAFGSIVDVVDAKGTGWLAGIRESYDYCLTCFKRKLAPETEVWIDGAPFDAWRSLRKEVAEGATLGRLENFLPLGLVRFDRSLKVTSKHRGADDATGATTVWYYTADRTASGAPGAVQVLLDGGDVTSALVGLPEGSRSFQAVAGRMVAARFDGAVPAADALDPAPFLARRPDGSWLTHGSASTARGADTGAAMLVIGEAQLEAGDRRIAIEGKCPAVLELLLGGRYQAVVALKSAGSADATVPVPASGWIQVRLLAASPKGDLSVSWSVDGRPARVRTVPLLGGEGGKSWSAGPLDLGAAGVPLDPGPHELTFRERSGKSGHLEYSLLVE